MTRKPPTIDPAVLGLPAPARAPAPAARPSAPELDRLFRQLVTQHQKRLHRFVVRHIGHSDDADDITQQAFSEAARNIERFRGESELSTWLYGIAMNLVRNYLNRSPYRLHRFESDASLEDHCAPWSNPSDIVSMQQTLRKLSESMARLPIDMREILTLVAIDEISYEDAAVRLSVPVGTIRSRLSRARTALRARLARAGVEIPC